MRSNPESGRQLDTVVLLFAFAVLLFASPLTFWWATDSAPWYLPYLLWLGLIGLIAWVQYRRGHYE